MIKIPTTATESTIGPQVNPKDRGIEPIAACTVAFGRYAMMQNKRSFTVSCVPKRQIETPIALNTSAIEIMTIAASPAPTVYCGTNKNKQHNLRPEPKLTKFFGKSF